MRRSLLVLSLAIGLPAATQADTQGDVVSWKTFAQVRITRAADRVVPEFPDAVTALDQKQVRIQGFMLPLEMGEQQSLFVLSAVPPTCSFCMPGGPEAVVEVRAKRPVAYTEAAVTVSGKLSVLKAEPSGIFYRLTDAVPAK